MNCREIPWAKYRKTSCEIVTVRSVFWMFISHGMIHGPARRRSSVHDFFVCHTQAVGQDIHYVQRKIRGVLNQHFEAVQINWRQLAIGHCRCCCATVIRVEQGHVSPDFRRTRDEAIPHLPKCTVSASAGRGIPQPWNPEISFEKEQPCSGRASSSSQRPWRWVPNLSKCVWDTRLRFGC